MIFPASFFRLHPVSFPCSARKDRGVVLLTVLWTTMLLTMLAAALVSEVRLSALTAYYYKKNSGRLADRLSTVAMAKMELMLVRMPKPPGIDPEEDARRGKKGYIKKEAYLFNGQPLTPHYRLPPGIVLRIYDHAGLIDLRRLTKSNMRKILSKLLPEKSEDRLNDLINSWQDWIDADDLKRIGGAEKEYYSTLDSPITPSNMPFETVDELLLVKGFADLFQGINIHAAFTLHGNGNDARINFNLATRDALLLVPGLDDRDVDRILEVREEKEIKSARDLRGIIEPEHLKQAAKWITLTTSNYYTIFVTAKEQSYQARAGNKNNSPEKGGKARQSSQWGYAEVVRARGYSRIPQTLRVDPLIELPVDDRPAAGDGSQKENVNGLFRKDG